MKNNYITEIEQIMKNLNEKELQYLLTFIEKMFGSR